MSAAVAFPTSGGLPSPPQTQRRVEYTQTSRSAPSSDPVHEDMHETNQYILEIQRCDVSSHVLCSIQALGTIEQAVTSHLSMIARLTLAADGCAGMKVARVQSESAIIVSMPVN